MGCMEKIEDKIVATRLLGYRSRHRHEQNIHSQSFQLHIFLDRVSVRWAKRIFL